MREPRIESKRFPSAMEIERDFVSRPPNDAPWRKITAVAVVGIMVLTGFTILGQAVQRSAPVQEAAMQPGPASVLAGSREATYTIDHMFELYEKSHDPADLGRWNGTMGLNGWWPLRQSYYQEYQARMTYPYVLVYDPYSAHTTPDIDMGNSITTWYRLTIDAKNLTGIAAGPDKDPIFTPVLGPTNTDGAWMNISWYSTYLETWELDAIFVGSHYANTYYGVPYGLTPKSASDDGYCHELQGKMTFNRAAASKILGLTGAESLIDQFTVNDDAITAAWYNNWMAEGGSGGAYDIYTAYDFSLDINWLELSLDPSSTADNLVLRLWSISWGNEILLTRYMQAADVQRYWQGWPDDWSLNITIGPDSGSIHSRAVIGYHMYATKDTLNNINGWALEASHIDGGGRYGMPPGPWLPFNDYDPDQTDVTHISWAPFTVNYGKPVSYAYPPLHWNLTAGEKFVVKLPTSTSLPGYFPQASTSDELGPAKLAEMAGNVTWGEMVVGNGYPNSGTSNLKNFYNKTMKTYTLVGPLNFATNTNSAFPRLLNTGAPMFVINVVQSFTLNLVTGWNLVSLPLVGYGYEASTLGLTNGDMVSYWNSTTKTYKSYIVGIPVNNFAMLPHHGYWINVPSGTRALTIYGVVPNTVQTINITVPYGGGWVLIGFLGFKIRHAADIPGLCNASITTIAKWNPATKSYTSWLSAIPTINNFHIVPGGAYWILVPRSCALSYLP